MKSIALLLAAAFSVMACGSVVPTPEVTQLAVPTPTTAPIADRSIDCGPIADSTSCASAVEAALRFTQVSSSLVLSIVIEPRPTDRPCPARAVCLVPTDVTLLGADGTELDRILLAEDPGGTWVDYPIAF
jgi:hypothetical protein